MDVQIGIGIGELRFGMTEDQVVALLGEPDKTYEDEGELHLQYFARRLDLAFDADEDDRLHWITCASPELTLFGQPVSGKSRGDVLALVREQLDDDVEEDDLGLMESVTFESNWLELQFEYGVLATVGFGHLFDEQDEPVWPELAGAAG